MQIRSYIHSFFMAIPQGVLSSAPSTPQQGMDLLEAAALGRDQVVHWIEKHAQPEGVVGADIAHGQQDLIKDIWVSFRALPSLNEALDKALAHKNELLGQVKVAMDIQTQKMKTLPAEHIVEMESRLDVWEKNKMRTSEDNVIQAHQALTAGCNGLETKLENLLTNLDLISRMGPLHADPEVRSIVGELENLFSELTVSEDVETTIPPKLPTELVSTDDALQVQTIEPMAVDSQKKVG